MLQKFKLALSQVNGRNVKLAALAAIGFLIGVIAVRLLVWSLSADAGAVATEHEERLDTIVSRHLGWAEEEGLSGVAASTAAVHLFFDEASSGTRGFAEDVLGWKSKWLLGKDYVSGGYEHETYIEERFAAHVFNANQLERLIESSVATYLQQLADIDSQVLVRLEADLQDLPSEALPDRMDKEAIHQLLEDAIRDAVASIQADFKGMVGRELTSFVSSEVLALAAAKLATSAGILGVGAGTGTVTFLGGLVVGIIVDYVVSWCYDALYDPVGEIASRLESTLRELEQVIINGDGSGPGLEQRLHDYASRRAKARDVLIRSVVLP